ncbi:MAG: HlyD family efflux transporter periplasmic adaptor subunit [Planctomycetes bacterium]|nr:HlyD family efflux transporter periplasmic adaptor subunit [Planctomycetota bacterium]MCW8136378.1 HlyD family efflux transporter periplasmic adaptor subunit [Planctomycetota bacterium]
MKWVNRILLIVAALAVIGLVAYGFIPKPVPVELAKVTRGEVLLTIDNESRTRVRDRYTLYAPVAATMRRITLKAGDPVSPGQVIAELAPLPPQPLDARARAEANSRVQAAEERLKAAGAEIEAAQADQEFATKEAERLTGLEAKKLASTESKEAAIARLAAANARLASARFHHAAAGFDRDMARAALITGNEGTVALELKAPVGGRVLRVLRDSEGTVAPGEPLLELGDPASLEVVADLLSRDAVRVQSGMRVRLERWGGEVALKGRVRLVEPFGFTKFSALGVEEQRVNVLIDFDEPRERWAALGDGYRVESRVILVERLQTLRVPAGALFNTEQGTALFVVRDGKATELQLKVGVRSGLDAEVLSGLNEGDEVIVHPGDEVKDGVRVVPR